MGKAFCILALATGCVGNIEKSIQTEPSHEDSSVDIPGDSGLLDDVSPIITAADAWCYRIEVGGIVETWKFTAEATDPQGVNTLASYISGGATFMDTEGNIIDAVSLICNEGLCSTTVNATAINASCAEVGNHKVRFVVEDEDGHPSDAKTVNTRLGVDENG